ncbi:8b86b1b1-a110-44df-a455-8d46e0f58f1b [Thermothielavioides terrestris]|uniref:cellulase n=2 Tax=Thermothielavioides terrestris TaxID=2587410 RepID=G2R6U1_THETT|nr:glycoside hydrolase family 5 protein [Thermothielavioides terrestris NRRL 8126]AEO68519.1 glycoside hydrolase family 5 protein [Thermothielavioides terrestris NRRL 8126]SPQ24207.1 8b86b1b1-a110-44df-a455-8d46e0f58f1b [Thermothielavioides terrestris]
MKLCNIVLGAAAAASALAAPAADVPTPTAKTGKRSSKFKFVGANESGAEFGNKALPGQLGKDYTWPVRSSIDTLMSKGMNTFRIPIMMERLIPTKLTGSINETYAQGLTDIVSYITGKGAYAVVDPHNFGRYYNNIISDVDGFKAWWATTAKLFASNDKVIFDTNNEYHDMDNSLVARLNQAAIDGIRGAGATSQYIFVEGNSWTGAWTWTSSGNGQSLASLTDPQDKLVYEMHQYLDSDGSGTSETCVSATIGQERIRDATAWLKAQGKKGVLGETAGGANAQCIAALTGMLGDMASNSDVWLGWLWWGAGPWWGSYIYGMEPPSGVAYQKVLPSLQAYI